MVAPSLAPATASAAFLMVLPAVSSSVFTAMFNPKSFPPQQALWPSLSPSVAPPCTLPSVQDKETKPFSRSAIFVFSQYPVDGTGVSIPGVRFPGHGFVAPASSSYLPAAFSSVVVAPGIPPVTPKLVAAIVLGVFTDFVCLLEAHAVADAPSFSFLADQQVIRPAKQRKEITDILVTRRLEGPDFRTFRSCLSLLILVVVPIN